MKTAVQDPEFQVKIDRFVEGILEWYKSNGRDYLFWRTTSDPYSILVSEMMLQKTTVMQVQNLIQGFLKRYPKPNDLAEAPLEEIKKIITPLGMEHRRAERFKEWAETIVENYGGRIPDSYEELVALPGVGRYTANCVLLLAFRKEVALLDTNIVRILERVFSIKSQKARARNDNKFWNFVKKITPPGKSRDIDLALLDYGASICTKKKPRCSICPINEICTAYKEGRSTNIEGKH